MAVGLKEGKVADVPGGNRPSLPSPRPLSQQAAHVLQLDTVNSNIVPVKRNNDSTATASLPDKGQAVSLSQPSTSATKFVPSFGKKGPPKSKPKKTNMPTTVTKSQPAPSTQLVTGTNDGDTASSLEEQLANEQGDATKQTNEAQVSKVRCKITNVLVES